MEALEFLKEHKRMCNEYSRSYNGCCDCPLVSHCSISSTASDDDNKKTVDVVEKWSKDHPRKTRQSVFMEKWPNVITHNGVIDILPCTIDQSLAECDGKDCFKCRREFWMKEVNE